MSKKLESVSVIVVSCDYFCRCWTGTSSVESSEVRY